MSGEASLSKIPCGPVCVLSNLRTGLYEPDVLRKDGTVVKVSSVAQKIIGPIKQIDPTFSLTPKTIVEDITHWAKKLPTMYPAVAKKITMPLTILAGAFGKPPPC